MSKKFIRVTLLSGLTLIAGTAFAADSISPMNPERNAGTYSAPLAKSRLDVAKEFADFRMSPVSADGWKYVGGEREWALLPQPLIVAGSNPESSAQFEHSASKPSLSMSMGDKIRDHDLYRNTL